MAAKIFGAAIFVWILQFKSSLGIGYTPVNPPISNYSKDENTTVYTVQQNETLRVSIKRINKEFEQILYKDGERILGLERSNKTVYLNDSGSDQDQLEKVQKYFHMKILNESHVQVIIYCVTNFVEGNYIVQYNGEGLLDEPHPLRFNVKFAESLPSLRPSPSTQNYMPDYITDSLPSTSPSASFFTSSQSLAPTTQTKPGNVQLTVNDSNIFEGDVISLSCSADGNPAVHTYQLFENDTLVSDSSSPLVWSKSASTGGVFVYRCEANNAVGTANSTTTVIVNAMDSTLQSPTMLRKSVSDESSESQNLSGGLIAVIVIAVVVAIIIAVVLLFYCCYRFNGKFKRHYQQGLNLLPFTRFQEKHNNRDNDLEPRE